MALIDRYIFRLLGSGFVVALAALTGVIWVTQALKDLNLFTSEGQSVFVFLKLVALLLPSMIGIIAPIALFIAAIQTLQRLNSDSEFLVMGAAGISPLRLIRPSFMLATCVTIGIAVITLWAAPSSFRSWRDLFTSARAEFVTRIVREGQFNTIDNGIVFHYRERVGEALMGMFIQDRRDPNLTIVYVAERGQIIESPSGSFLVLLDGSIQRETQDNRDASIIAFKRYALDLALLSPNTGEVVYRPRERSSRDLFGAIISGRVTKDERGVIINELIERVSMPLYSFTLIFIALAAFSRPVSTRQGKAVAITIAIASAVLMRLGGFALGTMIRQKPDLFWAAIAYPLAIAFVAFCVFAFSPTQFIRRVPGFKS